MPGFPINKQGPLVPRANAPQESVSASQTMAPAVASLAAAVLAAAGRAEVSRAEVSRAEVSRAGVSRAGVSRAEVSRAEVSRAGASRAGTLPQAVHPSSGGADGLVVRSSESGVVLKASRNAVAESLRLSRALAPGAAEPSPYVKPLRTLSPGVKAQWVRIVSALLGGASGGALARARQGLPPHYPVTTFGDRASLAQAFAETYRGR